MYSYTHTHIYIREGEREREHDCIRGRRGKENDQGREWVTLKHTTSVFEDNISQYTVSCWIMGGRVIGESK
jgi:hypothetical protein